MDSAAYLEVMARTIAEANRGTLCLENARTNPKPKDDGFVLDVERDGRVALIPVEGTISPYRSWGDQTNPYALRHDAQRLADDPSISDVVLYMDSPGGVVSGVELAVEAIEQLAEKKKVHTWNNDLAASAAYWLAAPSHGIYSRPDASTGSIGVYSAIPDFSKMYLDKLGIDMVVSRDGIYKGMGLPGKPITEEERGLLDERVAEISERFKGFVRDRRGLDDEVMQGQTYTGKKARGLGLIDGVFADFADFLAAIRQG